ncbi:MAG: response regulator [Oscillospiraceae bacterium]
MLNVLLVDDEPVIKMALRKVFDWEGHGFTLAGSCDNGEEALQFVRRQPVDIVITDLKMPVMDGITLIHKLKEESFTGRILILSNYSDFELARKAISAGADDYMLKLEITSELLLEQLQKVASGLLSRREEDLAQKNKEIQNQTLHKQALFNFLGSAKDADSPPPELISIVNSYTGYWQPIELVLLPKSKESLGKTAPDYIVTAAQNIFGNTPAPDFFWITKTELFILLYYPAGEEPPTPPHAKCQQLGRQLQMYFNLTFSFVLPAPCHGVAALKHTFDACRLARHSLFYSYAEMIDPAEVAFSHLDKSTTPDETALELLAQYTVDEGEPVFAITSALQQKMKQNHVYPQEVKNFVYNTFLYLALRVKESVSNLPARFQEDIEETQTVEEVFSLFQQYLYPLLGLTSSAAETSLEIQKTKEFLYTNYAREITLDQIADSVGLNKSYLSRLFKAHTGVTVFSFLTNIRMERAAALIAEGNTYIRQVAEQVGFTDQLYFTRVFKKHFGVSPSQYKKGVP